MNEKHYTLFALNMKSYTTTSYSICMSKYIYIVQTNHVCKLKSEHLG